MSKKLIVLILLAIVGIGTIGYNYNSIPIFKHSDNKANISFDTDDSTNKDDNAIKPIQPGEFLKTYKYELPTSFLGGELYVKVLSNNNLIVSSSVANGILLCDALTGKVSQPLSLFSKWIYCYELENGNCLLSSSVANSGIALYDKNLGTIEMIYGENNSFLEFSKSVTGEYILCNSFSIVSYNSETNRVIVLAPSEAHNRWILPNGNILYSSSSTVTKGLYLIDVTTLTKKTILSDVNCRVKVLRNGYCLLSYSSSTQGAYLYNIYDNSKIQITTTGVGYCDYSEQFTDDILFLCPSSGSPFLWKISTGEKLSTEISGTKYNVRIPLKNGDWLIYTSTPYMYLFKCEDNSFTPITLSIKGNIRYRLLSNGDVLITCVSGSTTDWTGIGLYVPGETSVGLISSADKYWNIYQELPNGNCLIASDITEKLLYYDGTSKSIKTLLTGFTVSAITEQADGTYLIETSDEFDYEYDAITDTVRLVYKVES